MSDVRNAGGPSQVKRREKLDHESAADCPREETEVEAVDRDADDRRELLPIEVVLKDRGFALRRPRARTWGARRGPIRSRTRAFVFSAFFRMCQRFCFQRRIAASPRSMARRSGRCGFHPRRRSSRQTFVAVYRTPMWRGMTSGTRVSVQSAVATLW